MSSRTVPIDVVVSFDFDAEEVWIGEDPSNAHKPGTLSQGTYGAKVAVPLLLDLLRRLDLPASFFVPGRVAERYPHRVEEILAAGHEVGHHGYTHTSPAKGSTRRVRSCSQLSRARAYRTNESCSSPAAPVPQRRSRSAVHQPSSRSSSEPTPSPPAHRAADATAR